MKMLIRNKMPLLNGLCLNYWILWIFQHLRCTDILMWAEKMKQKRAQHHGKDEIHSVTFNRYYA